MQKTFAVFVPDLNSVSMSLVSCQAKCCVALPFAGIDLGTHFEQVLNDLNMVVAWSNHERCPGRVVDAVNLGMVLEKDWTKNKQEDVQEPWSSGYRSRLMKWRLWGRIPAPYTVWTFFKLICCKKCIDVCLKMNENKQKRGREWPTFFKKSRRSIFSWKEELKAGKRFFLDQNIIINVEGWTRFIYYV